MPNRPITYYFNRGWTVPGGWRPGQVVILGAHPGHPEGKWEHTEQPPWIPGAKINPDQVGRLFEPGEVCFVHDVAVEQRTDGMPPRVAVRINDCDVFGPFGWVDVEYLTRQELVPGELVRIHGPSQRAGRDMVTGWCGGSMEARWLRLWAKPNPWFLGWEYDAAFVANNPHDPAHDRGIAYWRDTLIFIQTDEWGNNEVMLNGLRGWVQPGSVVPAHRALV